MQWAFGQEPEDWAGNDKDQRQNDHAKRQANRASHNLARASPKLGRASLSILEVVTPASGKGGQGREEGFDRGLILSCVASLI